MPQQKNTNQLQLTASNIARVKSHLVTILKSPYFKSAKKMRQFLSYVVNETIEGGGDKIKQYSIAVDALGYPDDFDGDTNPVIRTMAGRVRERLDNYYKEEGANDRIVFHLDKGHYAPWFEERKLGSVTTKNSEANNKKGFWRNAIIATFVIAGLALLYNQFVISNSDKKGSSYTASLVDVMPFDDLTNDSRGDMLSKGIRYQFITELSQFRMIRVRDISGTEGLKSKSARNARYRIKGALLSGNKQLQVTILLQDASTSEILWTKKVTVPATDDGFNALMFEGIKGVMTKISGPSGVMQLDAMQHLRDRLSASKKVVTTSYECVLLFYDYDNTKDPTTEKEARKCLQEHTSKGVDNSTLWSVHGLMTLLDWTKRKDQSDDSLYELSLSSFKKALALDPNNAMAYKYYGDYYMVKGRNDEAMRLYQKAVELNPSKPDVLVSIGWNKINLGDWKNGVKEIQDAVAMSYRPPAFFHIPLAVDAFRRNTFEVFLDEAEIIFNSGDKRGIALSLAAAIKLERPDLVERYSKAYTEYRKDDLEDPFREIGNVLKTPKVLKQLTETVRPVLKKL